MPAAAARRITHRTAVPQEDHKSALATRSSTREATAMSAFIDRAAVESGDETDVEQSDDEALHVDGYEVGDGFVVGGARGERCH